MGLILLKLNPMSFSSKYLKHENEPVLLMCWCLLSPCIITCISLVIVLTSISLLQIIAVGEITWNRHQGQTGFCAHQLILLQEDIDVPHDLLEIVEVFISTKSILVCHLQVEENTSRKNVK